MFLLRFVDRMIQLVRTAVLARLLSPADFGLVGLSMLFILVVETFSETGFMQALIQRKEDISEYFDTYGSVSALRGVMLFGLVYVFAPKVSDFFDSPDAVSVIRVLSVVLLLRAFASPRLVVLNRELRFKKYFGYYVFGSLSDFLVSVSLALYLGNVWAIVYGVLAANAVRFVAGYLLFPVLPRLSADFERVKSLFSFGRWITVSSVFAFLITHLDDFLVGKVLGVAALGFYQLAYLISNTSATEITHVFSSVAFPGYCRLSEGSGDLSRAYLRVLQNTTLLSFPLAFVMVFLAPDLISLFLGDKWLPMASSVQVLAVAGLIRSVGATTGPVFRCLGKPQVETRLQALKLSVVVLSVYPLTVGYGILGASYSILLASLATNPFADYMVVRLLGLDVPRFMKPLAVSFSLSALSFSPFLAYTLFFGAHTLASLVFFGALSFALYVSFLSLVDGWVDVGFKDSVRRVWLFVCAEVDSCLP